MPSAHPRLFPSRSIHRALTHRRAHRLQAGAGLSLMAVLGPGLLAGLSDNDPAGITTYAILGAEQGYRLLWVLALATVALVVFHELGARIGLVTGKGSSPSRGIGTVRARRWRSQRCSSSRTPGRCAPSWPASRSARR